MRCVTCVGLVSELSHTISSVVVPQSFLPHAPEQLSAYREAFLATSKKPSPASEPLCLSASPGLSSSVTTADLVLTSWHLRRVYAF